MTAPMPAHYSDPDLVALYDLEGRRGEEEGFYPRIAGETPLRILEAGCGTGWLAHLLARNGHAVAGLDRARNMLAAAREKPGADLITWIEGDMRLFDLEEKFDLIVLTGHAFQVLETDADIAAALACFKRHLAPGGRLSFETRNPSAQEWRTWTRDNSKTTLDHPRLGPVEVYWLGKGTGEPEIVRVSGHYHFLRSRERKVSDSWLRFAPQETLVRLLSKAGFERQTWFGNWDKSPVGQGSPELIVVAECTDGR